MPTAGRLFGFLLIVMRLKSDEGRTEHEPPHVHLMDSSGHDFGRVDLEVLDFMDFEKTVRTLNRAERKMALAWISKYQDRLLSMWQMQEVEFIFDKDSSR